MSIDHAHNYLLHPDNHCDAQVVIGGVKVPASGKLSAMLLSLFDDADTECDIDVIIRPDQKGAEKESMPNIA
jgi:hypothetical protein